MKKATQNLAKNFFVIVLIFLGISVVFAILSPTPDVEKEISISQLSQEIAQEKVKEIVVVGNDILVTYNDNSQGQSRKETELALSESLANYGVEKEKLEKVNMVVQEPKAGWGQIGSIMLFAVPLLIFGLFFWSFAKQAKMGAMQTFNFSKARARVFGAEGHPKQKINFEDVAGLKEAKEELKEIVEFLKTPKKFLDMGAKIPRGVLLLGPPGCGKTLLARATAGESNVPFFSVAGSEFIELFVGVGSGRVRSLFQEAKKHNKAIIFIDELDAIGRTRGMGMGGGHDEREQTLNQILVEMDGFERDSKTIIIAATNRPDILDPALLRPGRFDRQVILNLPSIEDREAILKIHTRGKPLAKNTHLREIAERTPGFSGADLENLLNEAAILAARRNKHQIDQAELTESIEKVLLGPERKSHVLSPREKKISAYHEAGHAIVASFTDKGEPVRKVSIVSRGMAAGYTIKSPIEEKSIKAKSDFLADIATLLGGYFTEKMKFKEVSTGASNDLKIASELARRLVKDYGMSEKLGPIVFGERNELQFLGKDFGEERNYSEKIAEQIDEEVSKIIKEASALAIKVLKAKKNLLEKLSKELMEKETLEREEIEKILKISRKKKGT
ncbi:ATP-dependent zinc metalloprotease FtsH [Patescibacteria group bacterium]|nr:ATP-dependent zinc metalloprotease FtsH [Patescibacteria group bacterium]MBU4162284.1 ATP-dependent zinc metalloprotease FtsH [Patescibacteria group bacterium]